MQRGTATHVQKLIGLLVSMTPHATRLLGASGWASSEPVFPRCTTTDLPRMPSGPSIWTPGRRTVALPYKLSLTAIRIIDGSVAPGGIQGGPAENPFGDVQIPTE